MGVVKKKNDEQLKKLKEQEKLWKQKKKKGPIQQEENLHKDSVF